MEIKVLGPGCANCQKAEIMVKDTVRKLGIEAKVEKVPDMLEIMKYKAATPNIMVNGKLKHKGKPLPMPEKLKELIKEEI